MIELRNVSKKVAPDFSLGNLSLTIEPGQTLALFGPSGCGKTTTLRLIAGFERPDQGTIAIGGQQVSTPAWRLPPHKRDVGMVFQDLALWPHMRVERQLRFCLEGRLKNRAQIEARIAQTLDQVRLQDKARAYPHELSGGQRQRLALARALVVAPRVLLLDEPFSSLDPHLRSDLLRETRQVIRSCGVTAVFVTHDWHEALYLAHRIAFMQSGHLQDVKDTNAATISSGRSTATGGGQWRNEPITAPRRA